MGKKQQWMLVCSPVRSCFHFTKAKEGSRILFTLAPFEAMLSDDENPTALFWIYKISSQWEKLYMCLLMEEMHITLTLGYFRTCISLLSASMLSLYYNVEAPEDMSVQVFTPFLKQSYIRQVGIQVCCIFG